MNRHLDFVSNCLEPGQPLPRTVRRAGTVIEWVRLDADFQVSAPSRCLHGMSKLSWLKLAHPVADPTTPLLFQLQDILRFRGARVAKSHTDTMADYLHPIGFADDGAFAFLFDPIDQTVGEPIWTFEIFDPKTNRFRYRVNAMDLDATGYPKERLAAADSSPRRIVRQFGALMEKDLNKHGIRHAAPKRLKRFPLVTKRGAFNVIVKGSEALLVSARGTHKIADLTLPNKVAGYMRTPDPRIIYVVLRQVVPGHHGPRHVLSPTLIGVELP